MWSWRGSWPLRPADRILEIRSPRPQCHAAGMVARAPAVQLLGRQRERATLDRVLEAARHGHGGVLGLYGDPGVGKTALLDYTAEAGADFTVMRAVGVEGEMELAFAAVQQLCSPSLHLTERLPEPQRVALEVALGLSSGPP